MINIFHILSWFWFAALLKRNSIIDASLWILQSFQWSFFFAELRLTANCCFLFFLPGYFDFWFNNERQNDAPKRWWWRSFTCSFSTILFFEMSLRWRQLRKKQPFHETCNTFCYLIAGGFITRCLLPNLFRHYIYLSLSIYEECNLYYRYFDSTE